MKVVHIVRQFHPTVGGLQNFVLLLAKQQLQNNIQVGVVTLNRSFVNNEILPETENFEGIEIKRIPFKGIKKYPLAFSVLNTIQDADIIHVHAIDFFIDFLALTRFIHKKPIILHTHGGFFHTPWGYHFKKIYFNTITRFVTRFANGIIACTGLITINTRLKKICKRDPCFMLEELMSINGLII